jgi:hypothetical protein
VVQCRIPRRQQLTAWGSALDDAFGDSATISRPCHRRPLESSGSAPPVAVVRVVQHYGWQLFMGGAIALGAIAALIAVLLAARWPGRRKPATPRETWAPASPGNGDVVWSGRAGPPVVDLTREPDPEDSSGNGATPAPEPTKAGRREP